LIKWIELLSPGLAVLIKIRLPAAQEELSDDMSANQVPEAKPVYKESGGMKLVSFHRFYHFMITSQAIAGISRS